MANANVNAEPIGRYCASVAESAVHYTNKQAEWTPNNIKRLIISPDMVVVQLHTHTSFIRKQFRPDKYVQCISDSKYKAMVSVLGSNGNNVCSHVEEIIYCLQGVNGGCLNNIESNLRAIISSTKASATEAELVKSIGSRFKRLFGIVYFNGNISGLMEKAGQKMLKDPCYHVADDEDLAIRSVFVHRDDWYKGYFFRPATYPADSPEGVLSKKLHKIERDITDKLNKAKADEARDKYIGELKSKAVKEFQNFNLIFGMSFQLALMLDKDDARSLMSWGLDKNITDSDKRRSLISGRCEKPFNDVLELVDDSLKRNLSRLGFTVINDRKQGDLKALAEEEAQWFKMWAIRQYDALEHFYLLLFNILFETYPVFTESFYACNSKAISFTSNAKMGDLKGRFSGASLEKSLITMCQHITSIMLDDGYEKYTKAKYWESLAFKLKRQGR